MTPSTIENTEAVNPDGELRQGLFAAQAARIVELQAEIASRQEEIDNLKSLILDSHPVGTYQAGNLKVQVKPGARRINAGTFEKAYPATKYPGAYQLRPRPLSQLEKLLSADATGRNRAARVPRMQDKQDRRTVPGTPAHADVHDGQPRRQGHRIPGLDLVLSRRR